MSKFWQFEWVFSHIVKNCKATFRWTHISLIASLSFKKLAIHGTTYLKGMKTNKRNYSYIIKLKWTCIKNFEAATLVFCGKCCDYLFIWKKLSQARRIIFSTWFEYTTLFSNIYRIYCLESSRLASFLKCLLYFVRVKCFISLPSIKICYGDKVF